MDQGKGSCLRASKSMIRFHQKGLKLVKGISARHTEYGVPTLLLPNEGCSGMRHVPNSQLGDNADYDDEMHRTFLYLSQTVGPKRPPASAVHA